MRNKKSIILISIIIFVLFALSLKLSVLFPLTAKDETGVVKQPVKKYMILIDVEDCKLFLIEDGKCVQQYLIAPGKPSTPSPLGLFKIVHKDTWGEGFGGRWMGLNVPWGTLVLEYEIITCWIRTSEKRFFFLLDFPISVL